LYPRTSLKKENSGVWGLCGVQILGYKVMVAERRGVEDIKSGKSGKSRVI
jgi:hypothetical protein